MPLLSKFENDNRFMQRTYRPKTKVALVADTENYLTVAGGTRMLWIDSDVDLKIAWSDTTVDIGIDSDYPTKVMAGFPEPILVPIDAVTDYQSTMYCHIYNETASGDVRYAEE